MENGDCLRWKGKKLAYTVHYPSSSGLGGERYPLVIICHGFTSTRIGVDRLFVKTAQELVKLGFAVLRFDYAGCGESDGSYGENEFACFIDQTKHVISFGSKLQNIDPDQVTLIGHSLGGAVAASTAAVDHRIRNVVLWSAVGHPYEDISEIVGYDENHPGSVGVIDHLGYEITENFLISLKPYSPIHVWNMFRGNALFIHGTGDHVISSDYCYKYFDHAKVRSEGSTDMVLVEGANHTYSSIQHFKQLIDATSEWLLEYAAPQVQKNLKKSV